MHLRPGTDGKRLVLTWANGQEGVDVTGTALCKTMAFQTLTRMIESAERKYVSTFRDEVGGGGGAVEYTILYTLK